MRITIDGRKAELATKRTIMPDIWSQTAQKSNSTSDEAKSINSFLKTFEQQAFNHYRDLMLSQAQITANSLKRRILGLDIETKYLLKVFEQHNQQFEKLVGDKQDDYAPATLERYQTTHKHTENFIKNRYKINDIDIRKVDHEFITDFEFYLRSVRKCNNNTAVKYIKNFKKIIRICIANGWLDKDPFVRYKSKIREVIRVILTIDEIKAIYEKEIGVERLGLVRDIFIFSCYTGLAYADVVKLQKTDISIGFNDEPWIRIKRKKTDTVSSIPLLPVALNLIEKYNNHPNAKDKVFPSLSNQKINAYLKEIADLCGIQKHLTFHIARHSFATSITLNNNVPIESVSKMLGHTNLRTTQHYAKILDKKIGADMKLLQAKLMTNSKENP